MNRLPISGGVALWALLGLSVVAWAILIWHPWIDWFGRVR
jgi:hypothetical protein